MDVISNSAARYVRLREEEMSVDEYLALCQRDAMAYEGAARRMLAAIREPEMVDTRNDPRLSRLFANKVIRRYPAFAEFYGMEDAIEQVVSFFRHAAQGLEERKQILYLLGPVGGGKSSIAERLKYLMQKVPFYALKGSPVLAYLQQRGQIAAMTKAASYLLWLGAFSTIRSYLLEHMVWMASDATGVPPRWAKKNASGPIPPSFIAASAAATSFMSASRPLDSTPSRQQNRRAIAA